MKVSVNLLHEREIPIARVLTLEPKEFLTIDIGECSIILPGFDDDAAVYALRLAEILTTAVHTMKARV